MLKVLKKVRKVKLSLAQKNNYQNLYTVLCTVDLMNVFQNIQFCIIFFLSLKKSFIFCKIAKMYTKFWFRVSRNCEDFRYFLYFSLRIISFRIHNIPFRFKTKQAKLTLFCAISLRSFSLLFRFVSLPSEMWGHPMNAPYP